MSTAGGRRGRRAAAFAVAFCIAGVAAGCHVVPSEPSASPAASPRPLRVEEADRLAIARFLAFQDGCTEFRTLVEAEGVEVSLRGRVDHRSGVGLASATADGDTAVVMWDADTLVGWPDAGGAEFPTAPPAEAGGARPLDPSASAVDTVLLLLTSLAADRPDNAQLLRQSDARWLRADEVAGEPVDVFAGPSDPDHPETADTQTRYWVDAEGRVVRFEAGLASQTVVIDLVPRPDVTVARVPALDEG
ncbi:hypothetical protein [Microbacterium hydrocarbonoxydans]|uniref:hypothetical protein n=1 Tax=Microbacterium hydrocarbonoxydans TaxID=273678 RepID=UPI00203B6774|nr:hypothetical protein [Microbacterium hydrocarbonoxydans]MCM3778755.1 hypothetical protein [Microbacterium hydrocarbonoxydans]